MKTLSIVVLVLLLLGGGVWYMGRGLFWTRTFDPGTSTTSGDVESCTSVKIPAEAKEFRVATFDYGQARLVFVRFVAPVDVCKTYASAVMPGATLAPLKWDQMHFDQSAVYTASYQIGDVRWFDLPYVMSLWNTAGGKPTFQRPPGQNIPNFPQMIGADIDTATQGYLQTSVRIDISRGVFYFYRMN